MSALLSIAVNPVTCSQRAAGRSCPCHPGVFCSCFWHVRLKRLQRAVRTATLPMPRILNCRYSNADLRCHCLNFHGRVKEASVKNFQLVRFQLETKPQDISAIPILNNPTPRSGHLTMVFRTSESSQPPQGACDCSFRL